MLDVFHLIVFHNTLNVETREFNNRLHIIRAYYFIMSSICYASKPRGIVVQSTVVVLKSRFVLRALPSPGPTLKFATTGTRVIVW